MSLDNQISISFTTDELKSIDGALDVIENVLAGKAVALTPEENQLYGRLGHRVENFAKMIHDDSLTTPAVVPAFVDNAEWQKDVDARGAILPRLTRLNAVEQKLDETARLVGFDIFHTCSAVYNNAKYLASQDVPGMKTLYEKWAVQYPRPSRKKKGGTTGSTGTTGTPTVG